MKNVKVGVVGCGAISNAYNVGTEKFDIVEIKSCTDLFPEKAQKAEEDYGWKAVEFDEIMNDSEIEIILNITQPFGHFEVAKKALLAGKSVYNEKPLCIEREEAQELLAIAKEKNLRVGCAPDTFMGTGIQTCIKVISDGWIGKPIGFNAFMMAHGWESWHPSPDFYYKKGGGPMFDMGPYYLTALVTMLGPIAEVSGLNSKAFNTRTITSKPLFGQKIEVDVPTHVAGLLQFENGVIGNLTTSFDVWKHECPIIEIYGTLGTLSVPDPNKPYGKIKIFSPQHDPEDKTWKELPFTHPFCKQTRGMGLADMAYAIRSGRKHRANGELAYHVLDVMHAIHDSAAQRKQITVQSTCEQPAQLKMDLPYGILDE